ncbi:MAG: right-handed parallel beta-helix repeat-containing protein [bacterium]
MKHPQKLYGLCLGTALLAMLVSPAAHAQNFGGFPTITKQEEAKKAAQQKAQQNKNNPKEEAEIVRPDYLVVDSRARSDKSYTSIQAAINDVAWGGVIVVMPGDYHENLDLRKPVSIQGDRGPGSRVRIYPQDGSRPCLNYQPHADSDHALLSNVEFRTSQMTYETAGYGSAAEAKFSNISDQDTPCIAIKSGVFTMKETTVDGNNTHNGALVAITGGTAFLEKNKITGGTDGILVNQSHPLWDRTLLVDNIVTHNKFNGLHLTGVSNMLATGNMINENGQGINYNGEGSTTLVGNKILNNRGNGVFLGNDAKQILIRLNQIWSNSGDGVKIIRSNGLIEDNDIDGNGGMEINTMELRGNEPKIINDVGVNAKSYSKKSSRR